MTQPKTYEALQAERDDLLAALKQCYAHMGWRPAKVPAHVADDALAAITKAEAA